MSGVSYSELRRRWVQAYGEGGTMSEGVHQGVIIRLDSVKGYGFIKPAKGEEQYFFHRSSLQDATFEELREGQVIRFEAEPSAKGARAGKVYTAQDEGCSTTVLDSVKGKRATH